VYWDECFIEAQLEKQRAEDGNGESPILEQNPRTMAVRVSELVKKSLDFLDQSVGFL
jgi:hypothetical protein